MMDNLEYEDDRNGSGNMDIEDEDMVNEYNNDNNQSSKNDGKEKAPNIHIKPAGMKQKRRSKNDSLGRDYVCGCGKTYLSYPALYTHIKTKHNGKTPDGTNANQVQNGRGRGRPRKNFLINEDSHRKKRELRDGTALDEKFHEIKELYNHYDKSSFRKSNISEETYMTIYHGLGLLGNNTDALDDFIDLNPEVLDRKSFESYLKIYEKAKYYYENPQVLKGILTPNSNEFAEKKYKFNLNKNLKCDDLFGIYLNDISNYINSTFYKSVIILLRHYRDCMNSLGWEILEKYNDLIHEYTQYDFCSVKSGEILPDVCNDFLKVYLPKKLPSFDLHIARIVICEFCDWLYRKQYTHIRINPIAPEI